MFSLAYYSPAGTILLSGEWPGIGIHVWNHGTISGMTIVQTSIVWLGEHPALESYKEILAQL